MFAGPLIHGPRHARGRDGATARSRRSEVAGSL